MTDETKHTPAPWRIAQLNLEGLHSNDGSTSILAGDNGICSVNSRSAFKRGDGNRHVCDERDANAALIAAAPDMLGALKEAVKTYKTYDRFKVDVDAMRTIEAVIAKAEGRSK